MIVSFLSQKGGVGKTTLAINVAAALATDASVLLIDTDPQLSASNWRALREESPFEVIQLVREKIRQEIVNLGNHYDFTVLDSPGYLGGSTQSCIAASDQVIIPVEPSGLAVWAIEPVLKQIDYVSEIKPIKTRIVLNQVIANTKVAEKIPDLLKDIDVIQLRSVVHQRTALIQCIMTGHTIFEWEPKGPAAREIKALAEEIKETATQ